MPQQSHYIRVHVRLYPDDVPLRADEPRHQSMWLGPLHDPVVASELAERFRSTYAHTNPQVTLYPAAPAGATPIPVDESFLAESDLVEAVRAAAEKRRAVVGAEAAGISDGTAPESNSGALSDEQEGVDWRGIFVKYRNFIGAYEGIDFLGKVDDGMVDNPFTSAEWEALTEACHEADVAAAQASRDSHGD